MRNNHSLITAFSTLVLVFVTYLYLKEVRKSVKLETSPIIFIQKIESKLKGNIEKNTMDICTWLHLNNCSKVEAKDIQVTYTITANGKEIYRYDKGFYYASIFPNQETKVMIQSIPLPASPKQIRLLKEKVEKGLDPKDLLLTPPDSLKNLHLDIQFSYKDRDGLPCKPQNFPFDFNWKVRSWFGRRLAMSSVKKSNTNP